LSSPASESERSAPMILFTAAVAACVIVYLFTALIRPEWY
jgi:hypothetical protein